MWPCNLTFIKWFKEKTTGSSKFHKVKYGTALETLASCIQLILEIRFLRWP